ncbi:MAG: hypothetical protein HS122_18585 [Opitutaceae bacterium]|nr:hypothetical protein [Opitutaceae bacterium]
MSWFSRLEKRLAPYAIPHLTLFLVAGQAFVYLTTMLGLLDEGRLVLYPVLVLRGEWWRIFTFVGYPPGGHWLFVALALYFLYFTGNALEQAWGALRYNLFLLVGFLLTVAAAFVTPYVAASNLFVGGVIFLAFAHMYPNFTMYVFFVLPVQIKWLAVVAWIGYIWEFVVGGPSQRLAITAALLNFFLFIGRDLWLSLRQGQRRLQTEARRHAEERQGPQVRHRCYVCGKTNLTNPEMDFRYCSKCAGDQCYCPDHIRNHVHVLTGNDAKQ